MYTLTVDDNNLYIPEERSYSLNSAKIKINSDRVAYLDFEIPVTNKAYGLLNEKTSTVKVYKDNVLTYKFFVDTIEDDFYYNRSVSCTSVVEYLSDSIVRPYSTIESEPGLLAPSSLDGYFQWLIDQHNAVCDTKKKFYVGVNQGASLDNNNYIYRASTQTPTVSSEIKDKILTPYPSAYITVSFDGEKNIINLYSDIYDKNEQLIDFGVNLLDFVKTADYSKCYTAVRPTGSTPESSEGNSSKLPITIESIPDGVSKWSSDVYKKQDVVYSISGVNKWGYKECAYSNSDIKTVDSLYQTSVVYLNKISSPALTIEVKAIDLSLLMGDKYSPLKVGQAVRIRSTPHNIDTYMTVSHIDVDVLDPTNDLYTLGESYDSLTGQQSAYVTRLNASINSAVDVIGSASNAASKLAEAASKKAQEAKEKADAATDAAAGATSKADTAVNKAENAVTKADTAISTATDTKAKVTLVEKQATEAKAAADTAKKAADDAATAADSAQSSAAKANEAASNANTAASNAQSTADSALSSAAQANKDVGNVKTQITAINKEMTSVKQDAATLRDDLTGQITTVKETMEADYTKKSELSATESNLKTEISKSAAGLRTEVSQTYSTKKELETTTKAAQTAQSTANAAKKAAESNASDLAKAVSKFDGDITNLKDQIDGAIQTWFYDGIPNALTEPEVHWTTEKDRQTHLGDLYYDNKTGFCYRYMHQNGVYSWARIKDTEVTKALSDAAKAQTTANAKKRIFIATPKPPYDIGDLWVQGSSGDIMRCQTPKIASQTYAEADWVKASKYTDDTAVKNLSNTVERTYATKSTVNQLSDRIEQTVSSVEEVRTDASAAKTTADNAQKAANNAAAAASTAHATATAAQTAANKAQEHATSAANAASTAKANADAAQAAANKANASLADAKKNLETLQNRADVTDEELTAAKNAVASAQAAADSANSAASKANKLATTAQSTADTAKQNAATAQSKANAAASAASTAQSTADTAKANAKKAQDDVNALKNRVTTAETSIKQNSEAIALRATKTEVTSAIDNVQVGGRNLLTNYDAGRFNNSNATFSYDKSTYTFTITTPSTANTLFGNGIACNHSIKVPYGKTLCVSFEVFTNVSADWRVDINNSSDGDSSWTYGSNDNDNLSLRTRHTEGGYSSIPTGQWVKCWFTYTNTNPANTNKHDLIDYSGWGLILGDNTVYKIRRVKYELGNKPTDWSPAPEDLQTDATNKANTALSESKKYTDAQLKITSDSITSTVSSTYTPKKYPDTRDNNNTPDWYFKNYPRQSITEFKKCSAIGLSGDTYCSLLTEVPWADASGGYPKQTASVLNKRYWRVGTNGSTWGAWNDVTGLATTASSNASTALSTATTANSTANSVKSDLANNYTKTTDTLRTYYFGWSNTYTPGWIKLGTLTSSGDNSSVTINVWSGNGYDGSASQNADWQIMIKDGYQQTASTTKAFGVTVNYGLHCDGAKVMVRATAHNVCDVWCYLPWSYPTGRYSIQGRYLKWEHKSGGVLPQSSEPSEGEAQSIIQETWTTVTNMQSSINQTAESIKSTVAATYVNNETLSSYATKSQLEQTSTSLTSRIQTTEKSVSGMSTTVKNVNDYMTFARENNQPTLTIGSSSSSFRTKLTNTGEKFMQGDQTIMELDGITSTVKASRVQMGHYQWRDTGTSMQLVYIP